MIRSHCKAPYQKYINRATAHGHSFLHGKNAWHACFALYTCMNSMFDTQAFSDYYFSLDAESKKRYLQKVSLFQGQDPYTLKAEALTKCEEYFPEFK